MADPAICAEPGRFAEVSKAHADLQEAYDLAREFAAAQALLSPWRAITDPRIDGFGNLPEDGRYLLVGNHTTLGLFDVPFLVLDIHARTGVLVRSLGEHRLRDLGRPEHVWQLVVPDLPDAFGELATLDSMPNSLPVSLSPSRSMSQLWTLLFQMRSPQTSRKRPSHMPDDQPLSATQWAAYS